MIRKRRIIAWTSGAIAGGVFAGAAKAQDPARPPVIPIPYAAPAQVTTGGPRPGEVVCETGGPIRRKLRRTWNTLQDNWVGYPQEFVEPPPGFYLAENMGLMKAKANPHKFTLYRTDFLAGSDRLTPSGASRFNVMATRLREWPGALVIEWSPDEPGLAEARRAAVLAILKGGNLAVIPERVVIGPSPYPGLPGTDAANNYGSMAGRYLAAPMGYSLTPASGGGFSAGSGGGTP
jgi:hypothetical protein